MNVNDEQKTSLPPRQNSHFNGLIASDLWSFQSVKQKCDPSPVPRVIKNDCPHFCAANCDKKYFETLVKHENKVK